MNTKQHGEGMIMQRRKRGQRFDPPFVGSTVNAFETLPRQYAPYAARTNKPLRRARGRRWDAPVTTTAAAVVDFGFLPEIKESFRVKAQRLARGKRWDAPLQPAQVVQTAPPSVTRARRTLAALRRGRVTTVIPVQLIPAPAVRARRPFISLRRGRRSEAVSTQVVVPPPTGPALPQTVRARTKWYHIKRGRTFSPPWLGASLNAFAWYPKQTTRKLRYVAAVRRGRVSTVTPAQAAPVERRRRSQPALRRGRGNVAFTVPAQLRVVATLARVHARKTAKVRRGRRWDVLTQVTVVAVQRWVPAVTRARHFAPMLRRGKRYGHTVIGRTLVTLSAIRTGKIVHGQDGTTEHPGEGETGQTRDGDIL